VKQTTRGVYDSPTSAGYEGGVQTDALLRAPIKDDIAPQPLDMTVRPPRFYRQINVYAWFALMGAGAVGWMLILKFF
jgi:hypothetical protein